MYTCAIYDYIIEKRTYKERTILVGSNESKLIETKSMFVSKFKLDNGWTKRTRIKSTRRTEVEFAS